MFLSFSAGNGLVMRKRRGPGGTAEWSLPCAISFGGVGGGFDFGAACASSMCVLNTQEMVDYFSGQHVKLAVDAQACAGPLGRSVEGGASEDRPARQPHSTQRSTHVRASDTKCPDRQNDRRVTVPPGLVNITADEASNLEATQCYTYGTSEGLFAGWGDRGPFLIL